MREGEASRTAQHNALFRALEQRLPKPLFHDPWARRFLRGRYRLVSLLPAAAVARAIDRRFPGPRAAVAVRTRYFDDARETALAAGVEQVVILGAGFDSRAHRLAAMRRVPVFEEIESDVKTAWLTEQKAQAWQKAYRGMRAKYTVLLPAPPKTNTAARAAITSPGGSF